MAERMVLDREGNEYLLKTNEKQTSQGIIKITDDDTHIRTNTEHEFSVFPP
ncbi:MAG: hypothetical protein GOV15_03975, partial [Candidatus Diapherotrites archaeon]|nr:hypothetical protein [Candidatus Diapherotrites archaeon]